ncbi:hypothetical protein Rsub_12554 [Raphidocelis subcapitata]|uniref:Uncharacterized protein n=1 Tax=Raphidocelis subcapitata TaxID=307507 RepID=A0A2V0PJ28_9CHLO|nr:hypothetical protein Rsub_12554 [Raphidocelis subcapitata]|eukprot:GBF99801.1 hypothetical protein Rsub_12554 [Raphidocelis subcapitata]
MAAPAAPTPQQRQPPPPYSVSLDPDSARRLAGAGATLLLLDVPQATLLGLDQQVFVVGPRFKGVKMVPPGVHMLSYQAADRAGAASPAVSTFLALGPREVVVRRWSPADEGLVPLPDEDEAARYAEGARRFDFDSGLAPYDLAAYGVWRELTAFVDAALLKRLLPVGSEISVMAEALDPELLQPRTQAEQRLVQQLREGHARQQERAAACGQGASMEDAGGSRAKAAASTSGQPDGDPSHAGGQQTRWGRCFYTRLPRFIAAPGATGAELTAVNLDKSGALEAVAAETGDPSGHSLLGELQFAYAAFLFGQSLEGFLQWKALLGLFLSCECAPLQTHTGLYVALLRALRQQLAIGLGGQRAGGEAAPGSDSGSEGSDEDGGGGGEGAAEGSGACPLGLPLVEELLPDSFLRRRFAAFFEVLQEAPGGRVPPALAQEAAQLESLLRDRLGWDFRVSQLGRSAGGGAGCSGECGDAHGSDGDEDAPLVVELTEEQRRMAGLEL